ncbi:MAG: hypothetical protein N3A02_03810, partial [Rectinema sp.]|nr:hypothetical protein [Rectinema sp.]
DQTVIIQVPQQTRGASLASTLKPLAESLQGKGGGGPSFFRARFAERKEMVRFIESAQTLLEGFPTTTPER